ncbi:glycoside hydrolase family 128 protein [Cenococcum geophilum 1.58]|uniref:glycoside hydrolase family 128 protein n=1 Tax=Cenococcum geophilum 1.58 TaxID=794803 RepID=UPI0035902E77|nr:glycoside hydrolase family 128 protein [Cenococcum geophilum 1.58]
MSAQFTKFGLLSLISAAVAAPFRPSAYSAGAPWGIHNGTGPYGPTGTSRHSHHYGHGSITSTSTLTETIYATETDVSTVYMTSLAVGASSVSAAEFVSSSCTQETYTVTAKNTLTVTIHPGASSFAAGASSAPASSAPFVYASSASSFAAGASSAPASSAPSVYASSASVQAAAVSSGYSTPVYSSPAGSSAAPISSEAPVSSSVEPASSTVAHSSAVVSSAIATSTAVSSGAGKRGLPYNDASLTTCFEGYSKVTWAYNWGQTSTGLSSFEYTPMLWGTSSEFTSTWESAWKSAVSSGTKTFLAFNEPDLDTQSNLSPADAAKGYMTYMQPIKAADPSVRLGSPGVTNGANGMGIDWLVNFQNACGSCDIDFVAIHWYESATYIQYFKDHVTEAHTRTGKNVWVTEFSATGSDAQIQSFLEEVLPWMDAQDWIERYSYFMASDGLLVSGTGPSTYGLTYATT